MKKYVFLFSMIIATFFSRNHAQGQDCQGAHFTDSSGIVVIDLELIEPGKDWVAHQTDAGFFGSNYYNYLGLNHFNDPGFNGLIAIKLKIDDPGTYHFRWHSRVAFGNNSTEHNDTWLRFPDAADFFGRKGESIVYPRGGKFVQSDDIAEGSSGDGWMKIYSSSLGWTWSTRTSDNDAHEVYVSFDTVGVYTLEITGRSKHHAVDRVVLFKDELYSIGQATNGSISATVCELPEIAKTSLTVNEGKGSGSYFPGTEIAINATVPSGKKFVSWTGDITSLGSVNSANTILEIGDENLTITAVFDDLATYTLSIINGSGSGTYDEGQRVTVRADRPEEDFLFDRWLGDVDVVTNDENPNVTVTMSKDIALEATYKSEIEEVILDVVPEFSIKVYPNPVSDQINISSNESIHAKLFSLNGRVIIEKFGQQKMSLPATTLTKGLYFLEVNNKLYKIIKK